MKIEDADRINFVNEPNIIEPLMDTDQCKIVKKVIKKSPLTKESKKRLLAELRVKYKQLKKLEKIDPEQIREELEIELILKNIRKSLEDVENGDVTVVNSVDELFNSWKNKER